MTSKEILLRFVPCLSSIAQQYRNNRQAARAKALSLKSMTTIFNDYYENNSWKDADSRSGVGSNLEATKTIRETIPQLLNDLSISSLLDIPCGDFHWMKEVDLSGIRYIGADIVEILVNDNNHIYGAENRSFTCIDLTCDTLPKTDMVICRDALVHLSNELIICALRNIKHSDAKHLLTTTFPDTQENKDIVTGMWRPINLTCAPFNLPQPEKLIAEQAVFSEGLPKRNKQLGLWRIDDIPEFH
jgi:hypothetical protein